MPPIGPSHNAFAIYSSVLPDAMLSLEFESLVITTSANTGTESIFCTPYTTGRNLEDRFKFKSNSLSTS